MQSCDRLSMASFLQSHIESFVALCHWTYVIRPILLFGGALLTNSRSYSSPFHRYKRPKVIAYGRAIAFGGCKLEADFGERVSGESSV